MTSYYGFASQQVVAVPSIQEFQAGKDIAEINITGSSGLYTFNGFNPTVDLIGINSTIPIDVTKVADSSAGVRIDFSNSSEILLSGITSSQIHVSDFLISGHITP